MSNETIPFLDLVAVHRELQDEFVDILKTALNNAGFIGGSFSLQPYQRLIQMQFSNPKWQVPNPN